MKKIPLSQGKFALVDDEDYEFLMRWKWWFSSTGYAVRTQYIGNSRNNNISKKILMHRVINKTPKGFYTDHVNGNRLDNRKINLRAASTSQNMMNSRKALGGSSKFKGVHWDNRDKKWRSNLKISGKKKSLGYFSSETEAAKTYNKKAIEIFGEFARLNDTTTRGRRGRG